MRFALFLLSPGLFSLPAHPQQLRRSRSRPIRSPGRLRSPLPGRQIVGGEPSITFTTATDVFAFDPTVFGISQILFVNDVIANVPASGVNVVVLQTVNNPFAAGLAADLLASQIMMPGPGFFVYFNTGLDLPRLVYSTDLSDNTADLKILARMTNFSGQPGQLAGFTEANFVVTPLPGSLALFATGLALYGWRRFAWSRSRGLALRRARLIVVVLAVVVVGSRLGRRRAAHRARRRANRASGAGPRPGCRAGRRRCAVTSPSRCAGSRGDRR